MDSGNYDDGEMMFLILKRGELNTVTMVSEMMLRDWTMQ